MAKSDLDLKAAFRALHDMELAQGSNAKKEILERNKDNDYLRWIAFACYGGDKFNAYPTFQFEDATKWHELSDDAVHNFDEFRKMLVALSRREITGDDAIAAIDGFLAMCKSPTEKKWYRRILEHDLKVGLATTFSKVWDFKSLTLEGTARAESEIAFPGVMRCEKDQKHIKKWDASEGILVEPKLDGLRLLFVWAGGDRWSFFSRGGKSKGYNENLKHIADALITAMKRCNMTAGSVDGEIMGSSWNDTMVVKRKNKTAEHEEQLERDVNFHVFDHLQSINGRDDRTLSQRRRSLELIAERVPEGSNVVLVTQFRVDRLEEAVPLFHKFVAAGYEGAILKYPKGTYNGERNRASKEWVKMKPIDTQDVRVTGWYGGRERTRLEGNFGGFNVTNQSGQDFNVGGGFSDAQRSEIMADINAGLFDKKYLGRWLEIEYQKDNVAKGRFPVFVRWRDDIDVGDK